MAKPIVNIKPHIPVKCQICGEIVSNEELHHIIYKKTFLLGHKECLTIPCFICGEFVARNKIHVQDVKGGQIFGHEACIDKMMRAIEDFQLTVPHELHSDLCPRCHLKVEKHGDESYCKNCDTYWKGNSK